MANGVHGGTPPGEYIGPDPRLKGKRALLVRVLAAYGDSGVMPEHLLVQFDDGTLPEAYGWNRYPLEYFKMDEEGA